MLGGNQTSQDDSEQGKVHNIFLNTNILIYVSNARFKIVMVNANMAVERLLSRSTKRNVSLS